MSLGTTALAAPRDGGRRVDRRRLPVAALGIAGGSLAMVGAALPWLTFFGGLVSVPGTAGVTGQVALGLGLVSAALGILYAMRGHATLRWALALSGAGLVAVAGWSTTNLVLTLPALQSDPLTVAAPAPGIAVLVGGAALVFATFFVAPLESRSSAVASGGVRRTAIRRTLAAALAFAGVVHLSVGPEHLAESSVIGGAMIAGGIAQLGLAALVAFGRPRPVVAVAAIGLSVAFAAAWILALTVGLPVEPHPHDAMNAAKAHGATGHVETITPAGVATFVAELGAVTLAWLALRMNPGIEPGA